MPCRTLPSVMRIGHKTSFRCIQAERLGRQCNMQHLAKKTRDAIGASASFSGAPGRQAQAHSLRVGCGFGKGPCNSADDWCFRSMKRKNASAKKRVNRMLPARRTFCRTHSVDLRTIDGRLLVKTTRRMRSILLSVADPLGLADMRMRSDDRCK